MDKLVTVLRVSYPQELWIIKGRLESEGIECFTKDELTVQAYSLYSQAIGGVKLQVWEKDKNTALMILAELGYLKEEPTQPDLLTIVDQKTANIFLLKRLEVSRRIIVLALLFSLVLGAILYLILKPDT
ncbi:MAG: putative signal transducing protein, partial [Sphingobacteriales bacterium]